MKQIQTNQRGGDYTSGSSPSSCSSPSEASPSASRGDKLDLLRVMALRNGLLALIHKAMIRLEVLVIFKLAGKGQHDLAEIPKGVRAALLVALLLGLDRTSHGLLQLTLQPFLLGLTGLKRRWYRETSPSSHRHAATAFTPRAKTSTIAISSSVTLGGSKAPGAAKFQDLTMSWTRESLTPESALMKLAEGCGASGEAPLAARVTTRAVFEGVRCYCLAAVRSPDDQLPDWRGANRSALASPTCNGAKATASPGCPSVLCFFRAGMLTTGLFLPATREGTCDKKLSLYTLTETKRGVTSQVVYRTFLARRVTRCCLSSSHLHSASTATCLEVVSPISKIVSCALA
ncbi:hypothetical protein Cgig2_031578 [Carnegiea gigantea]|uniref:Uncharacterized protein n=1 Tax=Carnegiea gigantea TaxID=171969 RepID=A0A9Q1GPH4_9CARY|nr:hypothetical protein Cgig2_031578 [Carnegiea gigantea]